MCFLQKNSENSVLNNKYKLSFSIVLFLCSILYYIAIINVFLAIIIFLLLLIYIAATADEILGVTLISTSFFIFLFIFDKLGFESGILIVTRTLGMYIVFLYYLRNKIELKKIFNNTPFTLNCAIILILLFGYFKSLNPDYGLIKILRFIGFNLFLFILPIFFYNRISNFKKFLYYTSFIGAVVGLLVISYIFSSFVSGVEIKERFTLTSNLNPIWFARALGISSLTALGSFYFSDKAHIKFLLLICFPLLLIGIFITGSRAPFLSFLFCSVVLYLLQSRSSFLTKISFISFVLISLIAVFVFFLSNTRLLLNPFNITDISALHRIEAWAKSIQLIRSNPLVGIGTGSFKSIGQNLFPWIESGWQYPHNILLELFVENGVLGISLFLTFLFVIIKRYLKIREKVIGENRTILDTFFCLFLFTLINSMVSGDLTMNANLWLFAGFIVSIGYNIEYYENETKGHIRSSYE